MKSKIIITGGSGFIGTNLIEFYEKFDNYLIYNIDIKAPKIKNHNIYWHNIDIRENSKLSLFIFEINPDYIIHLAARTDLNEKNDIKYYDSNIIGVQNILNIANKLNNLKRIIIASSMLVNKVGYKPINVNDYNPDTLYGQSKTETEIITKTFNLDWVIVRPTSIWGPWFSEPYLNFFNFIQKNLYFSIPSNESSIKTYGYVENTCYQINEILFSNKSNVKNSILYLGDYEPLNISDWADLISLDLHKKKIIKISKNIFYLICIFGEILKYLGLKNFPLGLFRYKNMTTNNIIDLTKTMEIAIDLPYPEIEIQVKKTLKWLKFNKRHN